MGGNYSFFLKKKKEKVPVPCNHDFISFPWYAKSGYNPDDKSLVCEILKPYVCRKCKYREDVRLDLLYRIPCDMESAEKYAADFQEPYLDRLTPHGIVEEQINDFIKEIKNEG